MAPQTATPKNESKRAEPLAGETQLLELYVGSMRARKALKEAGYLTVGDLRAPGALAKAMAVRFVGETTRLELARAAGAEAVKAMEEPPEQEDPGEVEEGPQPLTLQSRVAHLRVAYNPATRREGPGRSVLLEEPMFLEFQPWQPKGPGICRLSREMFLMRKYERDRKAVREHVAANKPWRKEAAEDLKSFSRFGIDFGLLSD